MSSGSDGFHVLIVRKHRARHPDSLAQTVGVGHPTTIDLGSGSVAAPSCVSLRPGVAGPLQLLPIRSMTPSGSCETIHNDPNTTILYITMFFDLSTLLYLVWIIIVVNRDPSTTMYTLLLLLIFSCSCGGVAVSSDRTPGHDHDINGGVRWCPKMLLSSSSELVVIGRMIHVVLFNHLKTWNGDG